MNEALITLSNLSIGYNSQPVMSGISLSIARDSFIAFLGANGSGKTTLMKTLLGLLPPVAGRIHTAASTGAPLVFGYVPQSNRFDPIYLLTGFDVALMGAYGRILPGRLVPPGERALARQCLGAAGAEEFAHQRFAKLSAGQKKRVLIARALMTCPDVLILDEPTAGVDITATRAVLDFISQIRKERRITVLLATHDFALVRQYAQQVLWFHHGKMHHGAADELLSLDRMAEIFEMGIG
jgi:ABC-type Mn2+/Zn2+ transport system ATPase subunit